MIKFDSKCSNALASILEKSIDFHWTLFPVLLWPIESLAVWYKQRGIVFLEQASWSGRCILGCLFRPAEVNRSNRNWHADAPCSPETVANSRDLRKTQPLGNDNGSRPWPLSSFSQDQRVGRSFCFADRSTKNEKKPVPLFFAFHLFGILFFLFQSRLPSDTRNYFHSRKIFRERKSNRRNTCIVYIRE